ncbi:hypothetical protein [uncultured Halomonas sp.]|uniref:hypothetical protein n=1 Tax=uncultured Halomonas sp. TaxID=173971 RepID=UPI00260D88BC|nr:hypothetical protein [uncultured Halomonas sp.]
MKYLVEYKCSLEDGSSFKGSVAVERDKEPSSKDRDILCLVRKDSTRFVKGGLSAVSVVSVTECG